MYENYRSVVPSEGTPHPVSSASIHKPVPSTTSPIGVGAVVMLGKDDMRVPLESLPGYVECKRLHVKIRTESFTYGTSRKDPPRVHVTG